MNVSKQGDFAILWGHDPLVGAVLEGWPLWTRLHRPAVTTVVLMSKVPQGLRFDVIGAWTFGFWDGFFADLEGYARSYQDTFNPRARIEEIGTTVVARLARSCHDSTKPGHFRHADLTVTSADVEVRLPGLTVAELKQLGSFLIEYAEGMENDESIAQSAGNVLAV